MSPISVPRSLSLAPFGSLAWPTRWMVVVQGSEVKGWTEEECFSLSLSIPSSLYISLLPSFRMVATVLCCEWMKQLQRGSLGPAWIIMLDDS